MDKVIEYIRQSNYATASSCSHHKYRGGLVDHVLEVYDLMMQRRGSLPEDSIAICAFLHDQKKTKKAGVKICECHPKGAIAILDMCNFQLTQDERTAILNHHEIAPSYFTDSLRHCLSSSDMTSTGEWKLEHPKANESLSRRLKNILLYEFSKL